jgi:hypothetical protein
VVEEGVELVPVLSRRWRTEVADVVLRALSFAADFAFRGLSLGWLSAAALPRSNTDGIVPRGIFSTTANITAEAIISNKTINFTVHSL